MKALNCKQVDYEIIDVSDETGISDATTVKLSLPYITDEEFPTVSIVIPTYKRKDFYELILRNWERIDYPREKLELVIVDDSKKNYTDKNFFKKPGIRYIHVDKHMTIGEKRNYLCNAAKNEYIVHMDDDDWYPPESVACRIRILLDQLKKTGKDHCVGCSKVLCIDLITNQMFEGFDPADDKVSPCTISESTMAYSKKYFLEQQYSNSSKCTECLPFIKDREDTVITCPSVFIVTQFTHSNNTVTRRANKNSVSEYNFLIFEKSLSVYDAAVFNKLRGIVISNLPEYINAIAFVNKVKEYDTIKFKKEYSKLSEVLKKNHLVINLFRDKMVSKKISSGRDIVYYCGPGSHFNFTGKWNPCSKELGGSEEAVVYLSNQLAENGYNVTVYCVLEGEPKKYSFVEYKNYYEWIPMDKQDITIIWRDPSNSILNINSNTILLDLHDAISPNWLTSLSKKIKIMTKSMYHSSIIKSRGCIIPNGIYPIKKCEKIKNLMVCTSSPVRCLHALLRALPLIRQKIPDAEIHWAYGFSSGINGGLDVLHSEWVDECKKLMSNCPGFKELGRLDQKEVNELYAKADLFVYPTRFPEIDCISLSKAMSAGCIPVCTPAGSISEKLGIDRQIAKLKHDSIDYSLEEGRDFDNFVKAVIAVLNDSTRDSRREEISEYANSMYSWNKIAKEWIAEF